MRPRLLISSLAAVLGLLTVVWFLHRTQQKLRAGNEALRTEFEQLSQRTRQWQPPESAASTNENVVAREEQHRELLRLRGEVALLRRRKEELEQLSEENRQVRTNLLAGALGYEIRKLAPEQIESYLVRKGRNAESLLAAFELTECEALLQEALERFPNDPKVNFLAATSRELAGKGRRWIEAFKDSAPDNALANYLSAQDYLRSGDTTKALQELEAAAAKSKFDDYTGDSFRSLVEAYLDAGYPEAVAKASAWSERDRSSLGDLERLRRGLGELAARYREAGEAESARAVLQMGLRIGQRLSDEPLPFKTEQHVLLGLAIQRRLLEPLDPASAFDPTGQTAKERLEELARRRTEIAKFSDPDGWGNYLLKQLSEQDVITYFERLTSSGELEARRWATTRQTGN